mmetsp:Transcript_5835/g.10581  ORF Transcript_5835/g.10581 Transcript_5835/m.10581 type:complete len:84 (+) Transcript_5835:930-1181(+)
MFIWVMGAGACQDDEKNNVSKQQVGTGQSRETLLMARSKRDRSQSAREFNGSLRVRVFQNTGEELRSVCLPLTAFLSFLVHGR